MGGWGSKKLAKVGFACKCGALPKLWWSCLRVVLGGFIAVNLEKMSIKATGLKGFVEALLRAARSVVDSISVWCGFSPDFAQPRYAFCRISRNSRSRR